jgi:hypothetical protein
MTKQYHENIKGIEPEQFSFIDEAGSGRRPYTLGYQDCL